MLTRYIYIREHEDTPLPYASVRFHPWINCKPDDREVTIGLAINKWLRDSGYQIVHPQHGDHRPDLIDLDVWHYDSRVKCHPNGVPTMVNVMRVACHKEERKAS